MSEEKTEVAAEPVPASGPPEGQSPAEKTQNNDQTTDAMRAGVSFRSISFSSQFQEIVPLGDYVDPFLATQELWRGLRQSLAIVLAAAMRSQEATPVGVVLAANPLLGLAAASLYGDVQVPVGQAERRYAAEDLVPSLSISTRLAPWLRGVERFSNTGQPLLMRGWMAMAEPLSAEFAALARQQSARREAGIICVVQAMPSDDRPSVEQHPGEHRAGLPILLDVATRAREIVAQTVLALRLPRFEPVADAARAMDLLDELTASGLALDRILQALNTPEHDVFERLAWRNRLRLNPQTSDLFNKYALAADEDWPRHTASIFLVSHFTGLNAAQFIDFGDFLAAETPAASPSRESIRPPARLTDRVLADCGIRFARKPGNAVVAMIGPRLEEPGSLPATSWAARAAEIVRQMFDVEGSLIKERYLNALATRTTLGDPSDNLAKQYADLEVEALRSIAAHDPAAAAARLCRLVFGLPAAQECVDQARNAGDRDFEAFNRAMRRAPALVQTLADQVRSFPIASAIDALCNAGPAVDDERWKELFRRGVAALFWALYAAEPARVALGHFPSWAARGAEARLRRREAIVALLQLFRDPEANSVLREVGRNFADPALLRRLVTQIALEFPRIVDDDDECCAGALLASVAVQYLACTLPGTLWDAVSPWNLNEALAADPSLDAQQSPPDLLLGRALLSTRVRDWFAATPVRREKDAALRDAALHDEGFQLWSLSRMALEGLVGSSGFGDLETATHDTWISSRMEHEGKLPGLTVQFNDTWLWKQLRNPDVDPDHSHLIDLFGGIVRPLFDSFTILILIAATRAGTVNGRPAFVFSDRFKAWLTEGQPGTAESPAQRLASALETAARLQRQWRDILSSFHLPPGNTGRVAQVYADRRRMIEAFAAAVSPFIRASRARRRTGATSDAPKPPDPATESPEVQP